MNLSKIADRTAPVLRWWVGGSWEFGVPSLTTADDFPHSTDMDTRTGGPLCHQPVDSSLFFGGRTVRRGSGQVSKMGLPLGSVQRVSHTGLRCFPSLIGLDKNLDRGAMFFH